MRLLMPYAFPLPAIVPLRQRRPVPGVRGVRVEERRVRHCHAENPDKPAAGDFCSPYRGYSSAKKTLLLLFTLRMYLKRQAEFSPVARR